MAFRHVLYPTDLSDDSEVPFAHALKIALHARGIVTTVHVLTDGDEVHWSALPTVREILTRWGLIPQGATLEDYEKLGLRVQLHAHRGNPVKEVRREIERTIPDLLVLGSRHRAAVDRWLGRSVAEPIARTAGVPTLFVPDAGSALVSAQTGAAALQRVIVPITKAEGIDQVLDAAFALGEALGVERCHGTFVHVGTPDDIPDVDMSRWDRWTWDTENRYGATVEQIVALADDVDADLIVMGTHGHDALRDVVLGSLTERVLHNARCPVLAVPIVQ